MNIQGKLDYAARTVADLERDIDTWKGMLTFVEFSTKDKNRLVRKIKYAEKRIDMTLARVDRLKEVAKADMEAKMLIWIAATTEEEALGRVLVAARDRHTYLKSKREWLEPHKGEV